MDLYEDFCIATQEEDDTKTELHAICTICRQRSIPDREDEVQVLQDTDDNSDPFADVVNE